MLILASVGQRSATGPSRPVGKRSDWPRSGYALTSPRSLLYINPKTINARLLSHLIIGRKNGVRSGGRLSGVTCCPAHGWTHPFRGVGHVLVINPAGIPAAIRIAVTGLRPLPGHLRDASEGLHARRKAAIHRVDAAS